MKTKFNVKHIVGISILSALCNSNLIFATENTDLSDPGIAALLEARYDDAKAIFLAQAKDPASKNDALIYLSKISLAQSDAEAAIEYIEKALALKPTTADEVVLSADAYCNLAQQSSMFSALKLAKKCIAQYQAAAALEPNHVNALASAARFYLTAPGIAGGSSKKGEAFLERLSSISPEDANTAQLYVLDTKGDSEAALRLAEKLKEDKFTSAKNQYETGRFFRDKKRYSDAQALFETMSMHSVTLDTKWYIDDSLLQLGELLLLENKDIPGSIALLEQYKQKNRNPFDVHYFWSSWSLAKAYLAAGEQQKYDDMVAKIRAEDYQRDKPFAKEFEAATNSRK